MFSDSQNNIFLFSKTADKSITQIEINRERKKNLA